MLEDCMLGRKYKTAKKDTNHKSVTLIDRWSGEAAGNHVFWAKPNTLWEMKTAWSL